MKILPATYIPAVCQNKCATAAALFYLLFFLSCKKNIHPEEHPGFVNAIIKVADTIQNKNIDAAFNFIDAAFHALPYPGPGDIFVKDSIRQDKYRFVKHDYIKALSLLDSMMLLVKGKTDNEKYAERYATVLYEKGECFLNMKRYNESFHYISLGDDAVRKFVADKCKLSQYSAKKAYLMFAQEKYLASAEYFRTDNEQSLSKCNEGTYLHLINLQRGINNVGLSYLRAGLLDSATWYENQALNLINDNEAKYPSRANDILNQKSVIYGDQAEVLAIKGMYPAAEALYKKSIAGTSSIDVGYTQSTLARLAEIYLKDNKKDSANDILNQLKRSLDSVPNEKQLLAWHKLTIKYYTLKNEVEAAFKYQQLYDMMRDSSLARNKKFETIDIGKEFENLELKYSNEVLQKEGRLKSLYLIITIFTFFAVAAIAFFVWDNLKRTRKLHQEVAQKNEDLQIALTSLEQSHEENNRIIRIVAHDLKSPISAINNLIFSLLRKDYPGDLKEIFQLIKTACSNSMVLINDALNEKKDRTAIRKELVDMKRLLEYCVDLLQAKADEKKQQLILEAENIMLMLNRQKMWRVVSNIVNNAIKFSPEHTVIDIKLHRQKNSVLLSVRDKGIGIPADLKDKIFTTAPEASRYGTAGEEPYGLGLSISQQIIEEHEGKIWFDSVAGKGAVFYVELPYPD